MIVVTLIGMVVLGGGVVGVILLIYRVLGRRPPKGVLPVAAGLAMFAFVVWNDYSWYSRTSGALPDHIQVLKSFSERSALQPWSYLLAPTHRFMAVDMASVQRNPAQAHLVVAQIHLLARYRATLSPWLILDCQGHRRADVDAATDLNPNTLDTALNWLPMEANDPLLMTVCQS